MFSSCWLQPLNWFYDLQVGLNPQFWKLLLYSSRNPWSLVLGAQCPLISRGQHGAIPHEPGCPKAIWGQLRRKKFWASEDLFTQNPDPAERNKDQICTSLVLVMAPCSGGFGAGWPYWPHSGGLGRQEGESGPIRERSGPSFGRAAVPQRTLSDFRLWLCHANGSQSCSHCQVSTGICPFPSAGCLWRPFLGGNGLWLSFVLTFIDLSCLQCLRMAFVACVLKKMSCWYWTLSVFVKLLFCINTVFDKHLY